MLRLCPSCGRVVGKRCRRCKPSQPKNPVYQTSTWRRRSRVALRRHRALPDPSCPSCGRREDPAIPGTRLTADHTDPLARGGDPDGPITVMCSSCNTRKRWRQA